MPATQRFVERNKAYAATYHDPDVPVFPSEHLAVVACMDARLDVHRLLGLRLGDAHVIRNAGGVVTGDVIRSLTISQRRLGTRAVFLLHHTDCGMQTFTDDEFRAELEAELGIRPSWAVEAFTDVDRDVRQSIRRVQVDPFLAHVDVVRGFVYDVHTGLLSEVFLDDVPRQGAVAAADEPGSMIAGWNSSS